MFVTFEGPDGAGKSTALGGVAQRLREAGDAVVTTRQPGDCSIGSEIRRMLLEGETIEPSTELFLYLADRAQNVAEVIGPALSRGDMVLCDRYADSTVVYQGWARGLDRDLLRQLNDLATGGLKPDLILLFDLPAQVGIARLQKKDRLDRESAGFHETVRNGFLAEAARDPDRWRIVDASASEEAVIESCLSLINALRGDSIPDRLA